MTDDHTEHDTPKRVSAGLDEPTLPPRRRNARSVIPLPGRRSLTPAGIRKGFPERPAGEGVPPHVAAALSAMAVSVVAVGVAWCSLFAYQIHTTAAITEVAEVAWVERALTAADDVRALRTLGATPPAELGVWEQALLADDPSARRDAATHIRAALGDALAHIDGPSIGEADRIERARAALSDLGHAESRARGLHDELYVRRSSVPGRLVRLLRVVD